MRSGSSPHFAALHPAHEGNMTEGKRLDHDRDTQTAQTLIALAQRLNDAINGGAKQHEAQKLFERTMKRLESVTQRLEPIEEAP